MRTVILVEGLENLLRVAVPWAFILLLTQVVTLKVFYKYSIEKAEFIMSLSTKDKDADDIDAVGWK